MSTLLEQASLVMIPSGYKEDTVFSAIPTDGSGDLSFTRASNGTRVNSAGLVEVCPWNLLQQSENYSVSPWSRSFVTVTPNDIVAPNGTLTGNKIVLNNSGSQRYQISQNLTTNTTLPMTYTFYAKKNQIDVFVGVIGGASGMSYEVQFNLTNVTATEVYNSSAINTAKSIESVGNDWYKCTITAGSSAGNINGVNIFKDTTGNGTDSFYIWGCQLNIGSTAKPYFPTTDRLNVPRLTYQNGGGGCPSLLLEKQSTNLSLYSEQFDNAYWTKNRVTITANTSATLDPAGLNGSDKVVETATALYHGIERAFGTLSGSHSLSVFAKAAERDWVYLEFFTGSVGYATFFNLSTGAIGTTAAGNNAKIENYGNGWYRLSISRAAGSGTSFFVAGIASADNNASYTGDGTSGAYFWGAQLEESSYPTSYIPTTSASATRVADACSKTGISSLIGQTEGTLFIELSSLTNDVTNEQIALSDGTDSNTIKFVFGSVVGGVKAEGKTGGVGQFGITQSTSDYISNKKIAIGYKANDFVFYYNGVQVGVDTVGTVGTMSAFNFSTGASTFVFNGKVNQAILFKTRLTNSELQSLTTL